MTEHKTEYKYETHLHTKEASPCGKVPAADAVKLYKDAGYTGIVVTDHYYSRGFNSFPSVSWNEKIDLYLSGYKIACVEGKKHGIDVFLGMEIKFDSDPNDYLVYGFSEEFLRQHERIYELDLKSLRKLINGTGIIIIQAHPYRKGLTPADPSHLDGIEVFNGNPRHDSNNHLALQYAIDNGLRQLSGSDFHQICDMARGGIVLSERITDDNFAARIANNKVFELIRSTGA